MVQQYGPLHWMTWQHLGPSSVHHQFLLCLLGSCPPSHCHTLCVHARPLLQQRHGIYKINYGKCAHHYLLHPRSWLVLCLLRQVVSKVSHKVSNIYSLFLPAFTVSAFCFAACCPVWALDADLDLCADFKLEAWLSVRGRFAGCCAVFCVVSCCLLSKW